MTEEIATLPPYGSNSKEEELAAKKEHRMARNYYLKLKCRERQMRELIQTIREIDGIAEAGLCQFSAFGKHEFLKDIRKLIPEGMQF